MPSIRRLPVRILALATLLAVACDKGDQAKPADGASEAEAAARKAEAEAKKAEAEAKKAEAEAKKAEVEAEAKKAEAAEAVEVAEGAQEAEEEAEEVEEAPPLTPAEPGAPGPAYFAVKDKGVVMLDAGAFVPVQGAPDNFVKAITHAPDGGVYLLGSRGVMRLTGAKATMIAEASLGDDTGSLSDFAVTGDGEIWGVGYKGISHFDGSAWTTEGLEVLGDDIKLVQGVAVDADDRVWVISSNQLHMRDGEAWADVDTSKFFKRPPFFQHLVSGPGGVPYALGSSTLLRLTTPELFEKVKVAKKYAMLDKLGFSASGVGALRLSTDQVIRLMPEGRPVTYKGGKAFKADRVEDVTPDDSGRLWIATDAGVSIIGADNVLVEWNSGSVDALVGQVEVIGVVGSGPELPGEVGPVKTGSLKGKVLHGGAGFANADIEICPKPKSFAKSPCADSPTRRTATTDAEGNFQIDDVPLGAYGLAVKTGNKWQLTYGSEYGADMKEGQVYDIGSVKLLDDEDE